MTELQDMGKDYLFKIKRSKGVKALIGKVHGQGEWTRFNDEWEFKDSQLGTRDLSTPIFSTLPRNAE